MARWRSTAPVASSLNTLMKTPLVPPSSAVPAKPLLTQWAMKRLLTPSRFSRSIPRSTSLLVHRRSLAAAEHARGLDADHDRQIPLLDRATRLARTADDPEPALAAAAALRVDVALERSQTPDLQRDRTHLVARVRSDGLDSAERLVLDRLRDDQPLTRQPHPLQPPVVDLLMCVGVVDRPAVEGRPAVEVVGAERQPRPQQVAGDVVAAVGAVVALVVAERPRDAEAVEGPAADHATAGPHVRRHVQVEIGEAEHRAVGVDGPRRATGGARPRLWEGATPLRLAERDDRKGFLLGSRLADAPSIDREEAALARRGEDAAVLGVREGPLRSVAGAVGAADGAITDTRQEPPAVVEEQDRLQARRLDEEAGGTARTPDGAVVVAGECNSALLSDQRITVVRELSRSEFVPCAPGRGRRVRPSSESARIRRTPPLIRCPRRRCRSRPARPTRSRARTRSGAAHWFRG